MTNKRGNSRYSQEFKESIRALHQNGRSATLLSKEYQVSVSTICNGVNLENLDNNTFISSRERELIKENHG